MKKKIMASMLALTIVVGMSVPAFAEETSNPTITTDEYTQDEIESGASTTVTVNGGASTFSVTLPKTMNGSADTEKKINWNYNVIVEGDVSGSTVVTVEPQEKFNLVQANKGTIEATVTQSVIKFVAPNYAETITAVDTAKMNESGNKDKVTTTGTVSASGITAGIWECTFNFDITVTESTSASTTD